MTPGAVDAREVAARLSAAGCVYAADETRLLVEAAGSPAELEDSVRRREAGEPLEHILGWAEFGGLRIAVAPGVFVPRRRTELLVRLAVGVTRPGAVVVDLCTGSGAIAAAVATQVAVGELYAVDTDAAAAQCARRNLATLGGEVLVGDLFAPLPRRLRGRVDVVTANAPYVPTAAIALMPAEARDHESPPALDGGPDGLDVQRRIAAGVTGWLVPGGHLLMEASRGQAARSRDLLRAAGLTVEVRHDDELEATVVVATAPG
jgi:release factor glutamine methyltransferase